MVKNGKKSKQLYEKKMAPEMIHIALKATKHTNICIQSCKKPFRTTDIIWTFKIHRPCIPPEYHLISAVLKTKQKLIPKKK